MGRLLVSFAYLLLIVLVAGTVAAALGYAEYTRPGPLKVSRVVVILKGQGLEQIADTLVANGIIKNALVFVIGTQLSGSARHLKAGEYRFPHDASPRDVARILESGDTVVRRLTIAEGLTVSAILHKLAISDGMTGDIAEPPEEGSLFPETYHYSYGEERGAMITRMQAAMRTVLDDLWVTRPEGLPYKSRREALIMASIIQSEAGRSEEMPLIAGVFVNRLNRGMRLQSDPTVAYAVAPEGLKRALTRSDLKQQHPYNTYVVDGLPPGPICNPGRAAIHAALNPADTEFLYFVADGTGQHVFARTLRQHNRNVQRWRRLREQRN